MTLLAETFMRPYPLNVCPVCSWMHWSMVHRQHVVATHSDCWSLGCWRMTFEQLWNIVDQTISSNALASCEYLWPIGKVSNYQSVLFVLRSCKFQWDLHEAVFVAVWTFLISSISLRITFSLNLELSLLLYTEFRMNAEFSGIMQCVWHYHIKYVAGKLYNITHV